MAKPLLQTTIAGSLPKPAWLAQPKRCGRRGSSRATALDEGKRDAVRLALRDQEHAGIDIVTDGEQTRRHFVTRSSRGCEGVDFEHTKTVRIRNRYDADVPMVVGPCRAARPVHVDDARSCARRPTQPVKCTLPGPMTMVDTLYDAHYRRREKLALAFAEILNEEAREIAAAGVDVIQFDEPAFNVYLRRGRDWGIAALERAAAGPDLQDRGAHLLRLRHQGEHRLEEDARLASGASTSRRSRCSRARRSTRSRSNARNSQGAARADRRSSRARTCWSARSTSRATTVETPEEVARTITRGA